MKTNIEKTKNGYSISLSDNNVNCNFDGLSKEDLNSIKEQIDVALESGTKSLVRVWNPRSKRHEIIDE